MKWLQWSTIDLTKNLVGGVDTYARSVSRELRKMGVEVEFSNDPKSLDDGSWDVIQTHGAILDVSAEIKAKITARLKSKFQGKDSAIRSRPIWVHTLHGLTHERMIICQNYF